MAVTQEATVQVYVRLLEEGVEVWRPAKAKRVGDAYLLQGPVPKDEHWEFPPGSLVRCRLTSFQDDHQERLVASDLAPAEGSTDSSLTWGDTVRVKRGARAEWRPGAVAAVCGIRSVESLDVAMKHGCQVGSRLLLIEFGDGEAEEVPEDWLEVP